VEARVSYNLGRKEEKVKGSGLDVQNSQMRETAKTQKPDKERPEKEQSPLTTPWNEMGSWSANNNR